MTDISLDQDERKVLDWVESRGDHMIDTVKAWSRINSGSRNLDGLETMRSVLSDAFSELEGDVSAVELKPSTTVELDGDIKEVPYTPSMKVSKRPEAPVRIVLTGHHDTVFPKGCGFEDWRLLDDDTLNGPGVADMKGGLLVMLHALLALERSPWASQIGYDVLVSPDEEIGSLGSGPVLMDLGAKAHVGMTYEPALADGSLAGARKGSGNFSLRCRGRAAHAGREHHLGRNAIVAAAEFARGLDLLNGQRPDITFNVSRIDGGGAPNVVPDLGICRFNVRVKTEEDALWAKTEIETLVRAADARDGITADLHGGFTRPPKPMSPANQRMFDWTRTAGQAIGLDIKWADTGGVCEGNNLWASGCPNVDTLGVRGADIHSDREIAKLSSFVERAQLSAVMLMQFARGRFNASDARALSPAG
ncbi:MAG: acetylornithine deacetylase [Oceanicaulis sp.]|uniref:hydrolase n=1 Tax=Oceanicaulis sp. UBA2681 TaxID=1947007 RepID=UPI000C0A5FF5|nr:hydrolase [Oceanicaulis sp. UBA2681]MAP48476.1 acetylornithine deacetylase [Oceanicaulis sp.]